MFGSIGFPEVILIFIVVLLVFGPKKLPEFAKIMGKTIREFRKTINEAKATIEDEIEKVDITEDFKKIDRDIKEATDFDKIIEETDFARDLKELDTDIKKKTGLDTIIEETDLRKDFREIDKEIKNSADVEKNIKNKAGSIDDKNKKSQ